MADSALSTGASFVDKLLIWWNGLSKTEKIIVIVILILVFFAIRREYIKYKQRKEAKSFQYTVNQEIQASQSQGNNPTYPPSNYETLANELEQAMGGPFDGTDTNTIFLTFDQMKNITDVLKLIQAFGHRLYSDWTGLWSYGEIDLGSWFYHENGIIDEVNKKLSAKGIPYQF